MLSSCGIYLFPLNIGKARRGALERGVKKQGGRVEDTWTGKDVTHILVDDEVSSEDLEGTLQLNTLPPSIKIVRTAWLSGSLKQKSLLDPTPFLIIRKRPPTTSRTTSRQQNLPAKNEKLNNSKALKQQVNNNKVDSDDQPTNKDNVTAEHSVATTSGMSRRRRAGSEEEGEGEWVGGRSEASGHVVPPWKKSRFVCASSSSDPAGKTENLNINITDKLQILADGYKSTNDKWRALSYEKAIQVLKRYPKVITNRDDVSGIRGIGTRITDKIVEIVESGELRKADEFSHNEKLQVLNLFNNIWGVGPTTSEQWHTKGFRTLEDVEQKAKLSYQQKIGLKYYDEFLERMNRSEAGKIAEVVIEKAKEMDDQLICEACGSYRRKKSTCGDVDILITHPDGKSHDGVLSRLVEVLTTTGFLTDHLVEGHQDGHQRKYMGVCKLLGKDSKARRIDIISVPYPQYATSLIYFTGSAHFTRSIYGLAKSMGMKLNQHGLFGGIMRQHGEKLNDGYLIATPSEKSVFERLGLEYREPWDRDHN